MSDDENQQSNTTDRLQPVDTDKIPILWDGNDAHIEGTLYEVGKWCTRTGHFKLLFEHHAAPLSGGRIAVDSVNAVSFTQGLADDPRDFNDPSPPTPARIVAYNARMTSTKKAVFTPITEVPDPLKRTIVVAKFAVDQEESNWLRSLEYAFGGQDVSDDLFDDAEGSGSAVALALRDRAQHADPRDRALAMALYEKVVSKGVDGEMTLDSLNAFVKRHRKSERNLTLASRKPPSALVEMVNLLAFKDPAVRDLYDLRSTATPPTTFDAAINILRTILRGRRRAEQLDEVSADAPSGPKLSSARIALLAKLGLEKSATDDDVNLSLAALITDKHAPRDPHKPRDKKDRQASKPKNDGLPRDKDGKVSKWVEGMTRCKCGGPPNAGGHLFRDCPLKDDKDGGKGADSDKPPTTQQSKVAEQVASELTASESAQAELVKEMMAFLSSAAPCEVQIEQES